MCGKSLCKFECGFRQTAMLSSADSTLTLNSKFVMEHNEVVASGLQFTRREDNRCAALISFLCVYYFKLPQLPFLCCSVTRTLEDSCSNDLMLLLLHFMQRLSVFYGVLMGPILILMRV